MVGTYLLLSVQVSNLLEAAKDGHLEKVQKIVVEGYTRKDYTERSLPIDAHSSLRRTALHWASELGHVALCNYLLDKGADPNFSDKDGGTPLHKVIDYGFIIQLKKTT